MRVITFSLYNALSRPLPEYLNDFYSENTQIHNHFTNKSNYLHKKFNRTNLAVYSTRNKVINIWNNIPNEIRQFISLEVFKKKMKKLILSGVLGNCN